MIIGADLTWLFNGIVIFLASYWGLFMLVGGNAMSKNNKQAYKFPFSGLPKISILVAVKNEENTIGRLIQSINHLNYPADLIEMVLVLDDSTDNSLAIVNSFAEKDERLRVVKMEKNYNRKPGALNVGLKYCTGKLVALLDADSVPCENYLMAAAQEYLSGKKAMTGYYKVINVGESWLSKLSTFESLTSRALNCGRNKLGLSVPIAGYNSFVDRELLLDIGGFSNSATEDVDLWLKLIKHKVKSSYLDSFVWIEVPAKVTTFFRQRIRWYGGYLQLVRNHLDLFKKTGMVSAMDALLFLLMPLYSILLLVTVSLTPIAIYLWTYGVFRIVLFAGYLFGYFVIIQMTSLGSMIKLKGELKGNLAFLPLIYLYMGFLSLASLMALSAVILRKNIWAFKTDKSGYIDKRNL
ncbi:MAG: glycosyltransferase family 2 protein [Nitrososphaerota archaeon]|nr:glycosyltransferase family 2 protein [Nitrososphaerota archaeon]MDG7049198.1 glycosyltransferase family 2 protein [Nitrososphaerota archaeon]MDG7051284.1 glycosyltransferase family 2 protein [Nitrososphaerota archaeon]